MFLGIQDNAILSRQALKIDLVLDSSYKLPLQWRYRMFYKKLENFYTIFLGNAQSSWYMQFVEWLDPESVVTRKKVK